MLSIGEKGSKLCNLNGGDKRDNREVFFVKVIYFQKRCKKVRESLGVFWAKTKVTLNGNRDLC